MRLLLDEMHHRDVAAALRERGHDAVGATERPDLIGKSDAVVLAAAVHEGRALVTENVRDFTGVHEGLLAEGGGHSGIVLTPERRFPRSAGSHILVLTEALAAFLAAHGEALSETGSFLWWLERAER